MAYTTADSGNILVRNYGKNPAVNFNFMLRVEGIFDLPCRTVRAFQRENEYELIQEGGLNDYVHMRRKPISKPFTFQVERYVGVDILDPLSNGTDLILPVILFINRYSVYGDFLPVRMYVFTGCTVMSKEYGELNAEKSGLLTETTTIAYREMFCMENVAGSFLMEEPWEFKERDKKGNGKQSARHGTNWFRADGVNQEKSIDDGEAVLDEFKKRAKKWSFNEKDKKGAGTQSAVHGTTWFKTEEVDNDGKKIESSVSVNDGEAVRKGFEGRAKKWSMTTDKLVDGKKVGNKVPMAAVQPVNQKTREEMESAAKQWKYNTGNKENNKPMAAVQPVNQKTKETMENAAKRWGFKDKDKMGTGSQSAVHGTTWFKTEEIDEEGKKVESFVAVNDEKPVLKDFKGRAKKWSMRADNADDGKPVGNKAPMAAVQPVNQKTKEEMESAAKQWKYNIGNEENNEPMAAVQPKGQQSKSEMEGKAQKWEFKADNIETKSAVEPEGQQSKSAMEGKAVKWEFKADNIEPKSAVEPEGQKSKSEMEEEAVKWEFKADNIKPKSAVQPKEQQSKSAMEGKAVKWEFKADNIKPKSAMQPKGQQSKSAMEGKAQKWEFKADNIETKSAVEPEGQQSKSAMEGKAVKWEFKTDNIKPKSAMQPKEQQSKSAMEGKAVKWEFKADNIDPKSAVEPEGQKSKSEMEGKAVKWEFKADNIEPKSAVEPEGQKSKSEMEGKAKKWPPTRSAANVAAFLKKGSK